MQPASPQQQNQVKWLAVAYVISVAIVWALFKLIGT
jgi:hypothetical protein